MIADTTEQQPVINDPVQVLPALSVPAPEEAGDDLLAAMRRREHLR